MMRRALLTALMAGLAFTPGLSLKALDPDAPKPAEVIDLQGNPVVDAPTPPTPPSGTAPLKTPRLDIYPTSVSPKKGTFIVCPGGAYHFLATRGEGTIPAAFLNSQGYDVALLEYTVGPGDVAARALQDALATVKLLQQSGSKLGLNTTTLGMMGFSAGGHLTARTVHELGAAGPFTKVIMIYPAYLDAPRIKDNGIKDDVRPPPGAKLQFFVAIGDKDAPNWVISSRIYVAVAQVLVQEAEYHLLPGIPHAFGITPGDPATTADFQQKLAAFLSR